MSLSSIMSGSDSEPPAVMAYSHGTQQSRRLSKPSDHAQQVKREAAASPPPPETPMNDNITLYRRSPKRVVENGEARQIFSEPLQDIPLPNERDVELECAKIETMEFSDVESPGFEKEKEEFLERGRKRILDIELAESLKRKVIRNFPNRL